MRITMLNDDLLQCDAAFALRELVKSPNPIEAASWQKLLELVDFLQSSEPDCNIDAAILLKELHLSKPSPPDPERDREFEIFLEEWRASHPDPQSWGNELVDAARPFFGKRRDSIRITVDWPDYGPLENGIPIMHYRFRIDRAEGTISKDARARDLASAKMIICDALKL
jgi:hypothetical protein